jgi:diguanylate cyclase (GGDEF)-like protein
VNSATKKVDVLLLEDDRDYAHSLKLAIESRLPVQVTIMRTVEIARKLLTLNASQYFIGITSVLNLDSAEFEKVDLLGEFDIPVIAIVSQYEDEMRDQLIKRHIIDYIVKEKNSDHAYICDLIHRTYKNCDVSVLVVDDSMVSRFVLVRELKLQKFNVMQAGNGLEALAILTEHPNIKLVLVDNQMPLMDGYAFVTQARALYSKQELVIIGVSSSADPRIAVKFLKAGANDFIAKPFKFEILLCRVMQNLDMLDAVELAKSLANTDFLSGLYNRRYFFEQGNKILQSLTDGQPFTVMMFDIDYFKKINDLYGHDIGDEIIQNFALLLKAHFPKDIVARIGGEEFAVISTSQQYLSNLDSIDAFRLMVANQRLNIKGFDLHYTCCIGVCNKAINDLDAMMARADKNLYQAKQSGRNQICCQLD